MTPLPQPADKQEPKNCPFCGKQSTQSQFSECARCAGGESWIDISKWNRRASLPSNVEPTAVKLLERAYPYIRHDPECHSKMDEGCECPVNIIREQIEDLIATSPSNVEQEADSEEHSGNEVQPSAQRKEVSEALQWLDEFVEEPETFPGDRDRAWWNERRSSIRQLAKRMASPAVNSPQTNLSGK